jgi:hypothetical protein
MGLTYVYNLPRLEVQAADGGSFRWGSVKHLWLLIPVVLLASCSENPCECASALDQRCPEWALSPYSMNLAVLVLDYQTYAFEGGNLAHYELCDQCDAESLPFTVDFRDTWDFAEILFTYTATGDTLFLAEIIWLGRGQVLYPDSFTAPECFNTVEDSVPHPADPERFQAYPTLPEEELIAKTDSAWAAVSTLDIVQAFAGDSLRVGFFFYAPSVGAFSPALAKWIVFLYRGGVPIPLAGI